MGVLNNIRNFFMQEDTAPPQTGRNDPCWCGSGKKYKKCHLAEDEKKLSKRLEANCSRSS